MLKKFLYGYEVLTGVEVAEADLSDRRHRPLLHASEQIDEVAVKIVIHLEGMYLRLTEQYAARAAEHVDKSAVFRWEYRIEDMEDRGFVAHP